MNKSELQTGMYAVTRNGNVYLVLLGTKSGDLLVRAEGRMNLEKYHEDLTCDRSCYESESWDVMKVFDFNQRINMPTNIAPIWHRTEVTLEVPLNWENIEKLIKKLIEDNKHPW